ncbi:MAG: tail fiber domain-containing protein [Lachnospiraceae bacterium]|nr:tail fiber domain-containing protein [Lachnospiraceae bacterium]
MTVIGYPTRENRKNTIYKPNKSIIMKNISIVLALAFYFINASAQLRVDSLGHAIVGSNSMTNGLLNVSGLQTSGSSSYCNIYSNMYLPGTSGQYYNGIQSSLNGYGSQNCAFRGSAGSTSSSGYHYAFAGCIYGLITNASAVYGSSSPYVTNVSGKYAGYFYGSTYVNGTLTATSFVSPSDLQLKENITALNDRYGEKTLDNVMGMNVVKYNYKKQDVEIDEKHLREELPEGISVEDAVADINKKTEAQSKKLHFGLIAQELQTIYPNLVEESEDGYLSINYVELVPILIRSIQELKQEVDELRGTKEARKVKSAAPMVVSSATATNTSSLYQNTPNPFKEQTVIHYRLADDAKNAAICIFNMQGKLLKKYPISSGSESLTINGYELGEGMFLYTLMINGQEIDTKRMILTK